MNILFAVALAAIVIWSNYAMNQAITDAIAKLRADIEEQKTAVDSAVTAIQGFPAVIQAAVRAALEDAGTDEDDIVQTLGEVGDAVDAETAKLTAALTANTEAPAPVETAPVEEAPAAGDETSQA